MRHLLLPWNCLGSQLHCAIFSSDFFCLLQFGWNSARVLELSSVARLLLLLRVRAGAGCEEEQAARRRGGAGCGAEQEGRQRGGADYKAFFWGGFIVPHTARFKFAASACSKPARSVFRSSYLLTSRSNLGISDTIAIVLLSSTLCQKLFFFFFLVDIF